MKLAILVLLFAPFALVSPASAAAPSSGLLYARDGVRLTYRLDPIPGRNTCQLRMFVENRRGRAVYVEGWVKLYQEGRVIKSVQFSGSVASGTTREWKGGSAPIPDAVKGSLPTIR